MAVGHPPPRGEQERLSGDVRRQARIPPRHAARVIRAGSKEPARARRAAQPFTPGLGGRTRAAHQCELPPGQYDAGEDRPVRTAEATPPHHRGTQASPSRVSSPARCALARPRSRRPALRLPRSIHCIATWSKFDVVGEDLSRDSPVRPAARGRCAGHPLAAQIEVITRTGEICGESARRLDFLPVADYKLSLLVRTTMTCREESHRPESQTIKGVPSKQDESACFYATAYSPAFAMNDSPTTNAIGRSTVPSRSATHTDTAASPS